MWLIIMNGFCISNIFFKINTKNTTSGLKWKKQKLKEKKTTTQMSQNYVIWLIILSIICCSFTSSTQDYNEQCPYSLSPVSAKSQKLLRSPRKATRKISRIPFKVLDAPELQDDFYLNLVDWSAQNVLAVGLGSCVYLWSACTSQVSVHEFLSEWMNKQIKNKRYATTIPTLPHSFSIFLKFPVCFVPDRWWMLMRNI